MKPRADQTLALTWKLLSHHELQGFGGIGEGMGMQLARDGRRILWLAARVRAGRISPRSTSTDPKNPRVVVQTELPHAKVRSNSLDVVGDVMAVAYQTSAVNTKPAGFDLSTSASGKSETDFHISTRRVRIRAACMPYGFVDGEYVHMASGAADFQPTNPADDQFYRIIDVRNLSKPVEVGRWWLPGTRVGDSTPPLARHPKFDSGYRAHNTNVFPQRPDRAYVGLHLGRRRDPRHRRQISTKAYLRTGAIRRLTPGSRTRCCAFRARAPHRQRRVRPADGKDWPKLVWVVDARLESNPVPISTFPCRPWRPLPKTVGASAPTTCTRTCRCRARGNPKTSSSAPSSAAACAPST